MTLPRSVGEVLADHVTLEVECIDLMYLNVYVPKLQYATGVVGFFREHRGFQYASNGVMAPMRDAFLGQVHAFVDRHEVPYMQFRPGERKDDVMQRRWLSRRHFIALALAAAATLAAYFGLRVVLPKHQVVVAARDIAAGQPISAADLTSTAVNADAGVLANLVDTQESRAVIGAIATAQISRGTPLTVSVLRRPAASNGKRAMSVPLDPKRAVAGTLAPGDLVDVVEVRNGQADYIVTGATVLAVPATNSGAGITTSGDYSVTLAVDDATALKLSAAVSQQSKDVHLINVTGAPPANPDATYDANTGH